MASEPTPEMVETAAQALCEYDSDPPNMWPHYVDAARLALIAALAVQAKTHVVVPREPRNLVWWRAMRAASTEDGK